MKLTIGEGRGEECRWRAGWSSTHDWQLCPSHVTSRSWSLHQLWLLLLLMLMPVWSLRWWGCRWRVGWSSARGVSQGRICSDKCTCCHSEIEDADQTFHLTQSQYTDTGPTSPSADGITQGAWQGSHLSAIILSYWYYLTRKNPVASGIRTPDLPLSGRESGERFSNLPHLRWTPCHRAAELVSLLNPILF